MEEINKLTEVDSEIVVFRIKMNVHWFYHADVFTPKDFDVFVHGFREILKLKKRYKPTFLLPEVYPCYYLGFGKNLTVIMKNIDKELNAIFFVRKSNWETFEKHFTKFNSIYQGGFVSYGNQEFNVISGCKMHNDGNVYVIYADKPKGADNAPKTN